MDPALSLRVVKKSYVEKCASLRSLDNDNGLECHRLATRCAMKAARLDRSLLNEPQTAKSALGTAHPVQYAAQSIAVERR